MKLDSHLFFIYCHVLPTKRATNIVLVVCPLNSIIEDWLTVLTNKGISANVFVRGSINKNQERAADHRATSSSKVNALEKRLINLWNRRLT